MLSSLVDTFLKLDDDNKNLILSHISTILFPIKLYLIILILLLIVMCITNYFIYTSLKY